MQSYKISRKCTTSPAPNFPPIFHPEKSRKNRKTSALPQPHSPPPRPSPPPCPANSTFRNTNRRQNCGGGRRGKWSWKSCGNGLSDAASLGRGKTVNPNRKRRQDGIAASSTERVVLTSKVNRFGKWSTFLENGKPKAANNGNDGQPKQERTRLKV